MRNEVIFDKSGIPDIMVAFTPDELGLPAELRGRKVSEYLISKYPNTLINGVPHSLPFQKPAVDINHDKAIELCEAKGPGWLFFVKYFSLKKASKFPFSARDFPCLQRALCIPAHEGMLHSVAFPLEDQ